ncbi:MAG: glycerate kinase [Promethearchaeota archaeon]
MYIKNTSQLFIRKLNEDQFYLRKIGISSIEIALNSVQPKKLIEKAVKIVNNKLFIMNDEYNLDDFDKVYIIGGGKATAEMAFSLENILVNSNINYEGVTNIPEGLDIDQSKLSGKIKLNYTSHPIPNLNGLNGTKQMIEIIENASQKDIIFCLISGGGSSLLPLPKKDISLKDLQEINSLLLVSGASIHEINTIRKHLSDIKGGNLAKKLYYSSGATLISLIISDVVGDKLDSIASGPTVPDLTTYKNAIDILKKYKIYNKVPGSILKHLEEGMLNVELETPKPNDACFNNVHNYLIGSVIFAAEEIGSYLRDQSFTVSYFSKDIVGEANEYGSLLSSITYKKIHDKLKNEKISKIAFIGTGELTVAVKGNGIGGRNQEMLLSFLDNIINQDIYYNFVIIAVNLDGIEGNSKAMGALVDNFVLNQTKKKNINLNKYLESNDSNSFFKIIKSEIITGQTGCNVNDLVLILASKKIK